MSALRFTILSVALVLLPGPAGAATIFYLELPLTDQGDTVAAVGAYGGTVQGGTFGTVGWTTTSRDDIIVVPLPALIDTSNGQLSVSVTNFEWDLTSLYWEQWALVALNPFGPPLGQASTGDANVITLYRGFNPDDASRGYHLTAYFNLFDPGCTDWHNCTSESRTPHLWLQQNSSYTVTHAWDQQVDQVTFSGAATVNRTMDLSATSPTGEVVDDSMFLMINACGGSTHNMCGPWDGPGNLKGGPVGVTYSDVVLELYGPDGPDAGTTPDGGVAPDGATGPDGAAGPDARPDGRSALDAAAPAPDSSDATPVDPGNTQGGCNCRSWPGGGTGLPWLLLICGWLWRRYAMRSRTA